MGEAFIVRKGGVVSETTAAPTITIISETQQVSPLPLRITMTTPPLSCTRLTPRKILSN
jgi:hypothetical protein